MFSGSYLQSDVSFLLSPDNSVPIVTKQEKEALIAKGEHYSDFIVSEEVPSDLRHSIYHDALQSMKKALGIGVNSLANVIRSNSTDAQEIVLINLVRAGAPLGVLLKRRLTSVETKPVFHYGISIIRDRGIDQKALQYTIEQHPNAAFYFVDGWTGKGTITKSLYASLQDNPIWNNRPIRLVVYSDPAGTAWLSMTNKDLLLPFSILNSTVAGLISRTIYDADGYHKVFFYDNLAESDLSLHFVNEVEEAARQYKSFEQLPIIRDKLVLKENPVVSYIMETTGVTDENKIKPSIAECTRALLRRVPKEVFISSEDDKDLQLISHLSKNQGVKLTVTDKILPYKAVAVLI